MVVTPNPGAPGRWRVRLLLVIFVSALVVPLALNPLPFTADGRNHILRTLLVERALVGGDWFARYFPELAYGYGAPLLSYYAPLTYYLTTVIGILGFGLSHAYQITLAISVLAGALGASAWAGALFGDRARFAAAVLWAAAPYTLFNVYSRGAGPEVLGLAWLPWLGWAVTESLQHGTLRSRFLFGIAAAGLMLTHNLTALIGFGLLTFVGLAEILATLRCGHRSGLVRRVAWLIASGALGLAASSFFWVPAVFETSAVQLSAVTGPAGYDFRENYLSLPTLLAGPFTFDPRRVLTPVPIAIGWGALAFALLGVLSMFPRFAPRRTRPECRARSVHSAALLALAVGCLVMTLSLSQPVWEALPMAQLIQFPYRWLGPASLFLALCGARGFAWLEEHLETFSWPLSLQRSLPIGLLALVVMASWPWTFSRVDPTLPARPDINDLYSAEVELSTIGLTSNGEFLPVTAVLPEPDPTWAQAVYAGTAERLDRASLPSQARVTSLAQDRLTAVVEVDSPEALPLIFRWFQWPGWQASIDERAVPVTAAPGTGFVQVDVPPGRHRVSVWLGLTPLRLIVSGVSDVALLVGLGLALWAFVHRQIAWRPQRPTLAPFVAKPVLLVIGLALVVGRVSLAFTASPFSSTRFDGMTVSAVTQPLRVVFDDELVLLGLDAAPTVAADEPLSLTAYWTLTGAALKRDVSYSFQIWDPFDRSIGHVDRQHPGNWPTRRWFAGEYAVDTLSIAIDPTTPPGTYRLMVTAYAAEEGHATLPGRIADGPAQAYVPIGQVMVTRANRPPEPATVEGVTWHDLTDGPLAAVGVDGLRNQALAGDSVHIDLYWLARTAGIEAEPHLRLRDSADIVHDLGVARLTSDSFGPADWRAGDLFQITTPVVIPANVAAGPATWLLTLGSADVVLGRVDLTIPMRSYEIPADVTLATVPFAEAVDLIGYRLSGDAVPGGAITLELIWRSREETAQSLKVFVHLLGADGLPAAQSDSLPAAGQRPTTGWLPPEIIVDTHHIALPDSFEPGTYTLAVGLYDPLTGARVAVGLADTNANGPASDVVELRQVEILAR